MLDSRAVPHRPRLLAKDVPLIDHPPPGAVRLAPSDLSGHPAVDEASRAQRQVTDSESGLLIPKRQLHPRRDEVAEHLTDCLAPNRHIPGRKGHHSGRLVKRYEAFDITCVHSFHEEVLKVLGLDCGYPILATHTGPHT